MEPKEHFISFLKTTKPLLALIFASKLLSLIAPISSLSFTLLPIWMIGGSCAYIITAQALYAIVNRIDDKMTVHQYEQKKKQCVKNHLELILLHMRASSKKDFIETYNPLNETKVCFEDLKTVTAALELQIENIRIEQLTDSLKEEEKDLREKIPATIDLITPEMMTNERIAQIKNEIDVLSFKKHDILMKKIE